jgi:hypothetical protein
MLSVKYAALALGVMFIALASNGSAQWSPGGAMVYMGDLNLAASSASSGKALQDLGGSQATSAELNNSLVNSSSLNSSSLNATLDNSTEGSNAATVNPAAMSPSADNAKTPAKGIIDLSGYARDRTNRNLAGYTNIMYPISGSRGTTTSTAGGGGCGCG